MIRACLVLLALSSADALFKGASIAKKGGAAKPAVAGIAGARGRVVPTGRGRAAPAKKGGAAVVTADVPFFQSPEFYAEIGEIGIAAVRVGTCALMIHHGFDKIANVDGFSMNVVAKFFGFLPGPPQFWTLGAAATQIAGAGLLAPGILSRSGTASSFGSDGKLEPGASAHLAAPARLPGDARRPA